MNIDHHMHTISEAARHVRARLRRDNPVDLFDLVQAGAEKVVRYLRDGSDQSKTLVFVCAKQAMLEEAHRARAIVRPRDRLTKTPDDPSLYPVHRWARHTEYDIEFMLDLKRELFRMPLHHAAAWYSRHILDEPVGTIGPSLGVGRGSVCLYEMAARKRLRDAVEGGERLRQSTTRIMGTPALRRHATERKRYAELRQMGASVRMASRGSKSPSCFATALRQLATEAA